METTILFPHSDDDRKERAIHQLRPAGAWQSVSPREPEVAIIVAAAEDGAIGRGGDMIWHMPGDLKHFKKTTLGCPIIMGRRTWESLPKKPLPGRRNIVVTRQPDYPAAGADTAPSLEEALEMTAASEKVFIIGGGEIYRQAWPLASELYFTRIFARCPDADTRVPLPEDGGWDLVEQSGSQEEGGVSYRFETYRRSR